MVAKRASKAKFRRSKEPRSRLTSQSLFPGRASVSITAFFSIILVLSQTFFVSYTVDDAFISFRFAENLACGDGLVFNRGDRVEGYTNFLWTVLLSALHLAGVSTIIASKVLGMVFGIGTLWLSYYSGLLLCRQARTTVYVALIAPFILSFNTSNILYAINGMETQMFSFFLSASIFSFIRERFSPVPPRSSLFLGLLCLTRPDGYMFLVLFALYYVCHLMQENNAGLKQFLLWIAIFSSMVIPHLVWRITYYGYIAPNTYYAKAGGDAFLRAGWWGVKYLRQLLTDFPNGLLIIIAVLSIILAIRLRPMLWTIPGTMVVFYMCYAVYIGGDFFPYFRFFVHVLPLVSLGILISIVGFISFFRGAKLRRLVLYSLIVTSAAGSLLMVRKTIRIWHELMYENEWKYMRLEPLAGPWRVYPEIGRWLKNHIPKDKMVVMQDVGAIPYYSNVYTIDIIGLVNKEMAHFYFDSGYNDYLRKRLPARKNRMVDRKIRDYLLEQLKVEYVLYIVNDRDCENFWKAFHYHDLIYDRRFQENYERIKNFYHANGVCAYVLFERKGVHQETRSS